MDPNAVLVAQYVFPFATIANTDLRVYAPPAPCDFIVGNPPFGLRWATMGQWNRESVVSKRSEDIFLEFTARHLRRGGSAIFVVPEAWPRDEMIYADTHKLLATHFIVEGEFLLNPSAFQAYGCDRISTKLLLIRTKLTNDESQGSVPILNTIGRSIDDVLSEWALVGNRYAQFRTLASSIHARLTLEQTRDVAQRQDKVQAYLFQKYVYHLSRFDKAGADHAWQRWAEAHKPKPNDVKFEEWEQTRLRPDTVIKETRAAVRRQYKKPIPLVRLSQTKIGLQLKSYGPAASSALVHQTKLWTWLDLEQSDPAFQCVAPSLIEEDKEGNLIAQDNPDYLEPYPPFRGYGLFRRSHAPAKTTVLGQRRQIPEIANREALTAFLATIRSRLTLKDLLGRDPLIPKVINIQATAAESALYQKILKETSIFIRRELDAAHLENRKANQLAIAHAIRLLQQACSIPKKYPEFQESRQAKVDYIVAECLKGTHSHTAIGTIWKPAAFEIAHHIRDNTAFPVFVYTGEESMPKRRALLDQFAAAPQAVLITTQQALRSSVNIRCVSKVIAESLPWNFSALGQYARRFVRYDSEHQSVKLELLVTQNTIEERILGLNLRKETIALTAAGDLIDDELDPILDAYGVNTSTLMLLAEYLAGEKDTSLNIDHLRKELRENPGPSVSLTADVSNQQQNFYDQLL